MGLEEKKNKALGLIGTCRRFGAFVHFVPKLNSCGQEEPYCPTILLRDLTIVKKLLKPESIDRNDFKHVAFGLNLPSMSLNL